MAEPEALVAEARAKGLHGFAITDHNTCACVDYFMEHGFMNKQGLPVDGLLIVPGQEITTARGHLLALGVRLPDDLKGIPAVQAVALIHKAGGLAIPPHPYDFLPRRPSVSRFSKPSTSTRSKSSTLRPLSSATTSTPSTTRRPAGCR